QAMLDLVPFARSRWKMAYADRQLQFVGQVLQRHLPASVAGTVATSAICGDQQLGRRRIQRATHLAPPTSNRFDSKVGRVVMCAAPSPARVRRQIIHAVGDRFPQFLVHEIMDVDLGRFPLRPPFLADILEISHEFLLFRVHRDHRLATLLEPANLTGDVLELGIAVRMLAALTRLAITLQAVAKFRQQLSNLLLADRETLPPQFGSQTSTAFARPAQRRLGVTSARRFHQTIQRGEQPRLGLRCLWAPRARAPHTTDFQRHARVVLQFAQADMNRPPRNARASGHKRNTTIAPGLGFRCRPQSPLALIQRRSQTFELLAYRSLLACASHAPEYKPAAKLLH